MKRTSKILLFSVLGLAVFAILVKTFFSEHVYFLYLNKVAQTCTYPEGHECGESQYCVQVNMGVSKCNDFPETIPHIDFPIDSIHEVICTQQTLSGADRTHAWLNTGFAVDLSSPPSSVSSKPRAVFAGVAITHTGCDNKDEQKFNADRCGQGFGNWVALISTEKPFIAFYAHLREVYVKNGSLISAYAEIGEEGKTGAAGHRHLHFSLHRNDWGFNENKLRQYEIFLPPSIPYTTTIIINGARKKTRVENLPCDDNNLNGLRFRGAH